jgi:hypothetical protein
MCEIALRSSFIAQSRVTLILTHVLRRTQLKPGKWKYKGLDL